MGIIIIVVLWALMGLLCFVENEMELGEMETGKALIVFIIFIIFGPCFVVCNILEKLLEWLGFGGNDSGRAA